jgi:Kelch motif protein/kelch motif-containing protein/galactose oxidase-like protein
VFGRGLKRDGGSMRQRWNMASLIVGLLSLFSVVGTALAVSGLWIEVGDLSVPRQDHTMTVLQDGSVLIVGGRASEPLASAEIYDPVADHFATTGNLDEARTEHTATMLPSGEVLVVGGRNGVDWHYISSVEIYSPATGEFRSIASLSVARSSHTATLLPDGSVLVVGGHPDADSAELFDPATETWSTTSNPKCTRAGRTATLLADDTVLATACSYPSGTCAEVYDPTTQTFTLVGRMNISRCDHAAMLLPDGSVLVSGGVWLSDDYSAEIYEPSTQAWRYTNDQQVARASGHTITDLPGAGVLVVGGVQATPEPALSDVEFFDPSTETWTEVESMHTVRQAHTAVRLTDGRVLVAGGSVQAYPYDDDRYLASSETFSISEPTAVRAYAVGSASVLSLVLGGLISAIVVTIGWLIHLRGRSRRSLLRDC